MKTILEYLSSEARILVVRELYAVAQVEDPGLDVLIFIESVIASLLAEGYNIRTPRLDSETGDMTRTLVVELPGAQIE